MRMEDFHFISAKPWLGSAIEARAEDMCNPVVGVPCKVMLEGEQLEVLKLKGFDGEYRTTEGRSPTRENDADWEILEAIHPMMSIHVQRLDVKWVSVDVKVTSTVGALTINGKPIQSVGIEFRRILFSAWTNPYFAGVLGAVYASLIVQWVQRRRTSSNVKPSAD